MSDGESKRYAYTLLAQLDAIATHEIKHSTALLALCGAFGAEKRRLRHEKSFHPHRLFLYERAVDLKFITEDRASDARLAYAVRTLGYAVTVANTIQPADARSLRGKLIRFVNSTELVFSAARDRVACEETVRRQLDPYLEAFLQIRPLLQTLSCWSRGRLLPPETATLPDNLPEDQECDHLAVAFPGLSHYFDVLRGDASRK